jgi:CubicO group peptidase (beta-lactamase class C family)
MGIDAAYASGDIVNTNMLCTIYRYGGGIGRSIDTQLGLHNDPVPGATGKFFAGGLTTSAADLGKLIALLAEDGCYEGMRLLSEESVAIMETRYEQPVPGGSYQALPLRYWPEIYGREGVYYHTGSAYGVFNCASYDPVTGDGVVVLTSGASGAKDEHGIYKICAEINDYIYGVIK